MHFIKANSLAAHQELSAKNWVAPRTYYHSSYHHDDGSSWCAVVEELQDGEIEIDSAEFDSISSGNLTFNAAYEIQRASDAKKALDLIKPVTEKERLFAQRTIEQNTDPNFDEEAALADVQAMQTADEIAGQHAQLDAYVSDIATWSHPGVDAILQSAEAAVAVQPAVEPV